MSAYFAKHRRPDFINRKPNTAYEIDPDDSLAQGLIAYYLIGEATQGVLVNLLGGAATPTGTAPTFGVRAPGTSLELTLASPAPLQQTLTGGIGILNYSVAAEFGWNGTAQSAVQVVAWIQDAVGGFSAIGVGLDATGKPGLAFDGNTAESVTAFTGATATAGLPVRASARSTDLNTAVVWFNGLKTSIAHNAQLISTDLGSEINIAHDHGGVIADGANAFITRLAVWNRQLTDVEMARWAFDPNPGLRPKRRVQWKGSAAAGTAVTFDLRMPLELLAQQKIDGRLPLEFNALTKFDFSLPLESLAGAIRDERLLLEFLSQRQVDASLPLEFLAQRQVDASLPLENTGTVAVTAHGLVPLEFNALTKFDFSLPLESLAGVIRDERLPLETLAGVQRDERLPLEWTAKTVMDFLMPLEATANATFDYRVVLETLAGVTRDERLPIEILAGLSYHGLVPVEFSGSAAQAVVDWLVRMSHRRGRR